VVGEGEENRKQDIVRELGKMGVNNKRMGEEKGQAKNEIPPLSAFLWFQSHKNIRAGFLQQIKRVCSEVSFGSRFTKAWARELSSLKVEM